MNYNDIILKSYELAAQAEHGNGIDAVEKAAKKIQNALFAASLEDKKRAEEAMEGKRDILSLMNPEP